MKIDLLRSEIQLSSNKPIRLSNARGALVHCMNGTIWITVEGETADVFLSPGQDCRITRNGLCLIESLDRGNIRLEKARQTSGLKARLTLASLTEWRIF